MKRGQSIVSLAGFKYSENVKQWIVLRAQRQFLHAWKLGFNLPSCGEFKEFTSELPEDLNSYLQKLN